MTHNPREVIDECHRLQSTVGGFEEVAKAMIGLVNSDIADVAEELITERDLLAERVKELERIKAITDPHIDQLSKDWDELHDVVEKLYYAAHWSPDRECDTKALWEAVRDAAGFVEGEAPEPKDGMIIG